MKNSQCTNTKKTTLKWSLSLERDPDSNSIFAIITSWETGKRKPLNPAPRSTAPNLAKLYLARANDPEAFARAVFGEIRKRVNRCRGLLRQRIDEVESIANCLFDKYITGNKKLQNALTSKRRSAITQQIERTINAVVSIAKKRTLKAMKENLVFMTDLPDVLVQHPSNISLTDLPQDLKMDMARRAVEASRTEIGSKTADLITEILERSCPMSEMARELGVSRQAIHMRLAPAIKTIRNKLENIELPNL